MYQRIRRPDGSVARIVDNRPQRVARMWLRLLYPHQAETIARMTGQQCVEARQRDRMIAVR